MLENDLPQTEWNLNQWKINLIGENYKAGMIHFNRGFYHKSFGNWKIIRLTISSRIKEEDKEKCKKYERVIPRLMIKESKFDMIVPSNKYIFLLEIYIEFVGDLLKKSGLDFTEKGEESLF